MFWKRKRRPENGVEVGRPVAERRGPAPPRYELRFLEVLLSGAQPGVTQQGLDLSTTRLRRLPDGMEIGGDLVLRQCQRLRSLGRSSLRVAGDLCLGGMNGGPPKWIGGIDSAPEAVREFLARRSSDRACPIGSLPERLEVGGDLRLHHCVALQRLPAVLELGGTLELVGCTAMGSLPDGLHVRGDLRLVGLPAMTELPAGLKVDGDLIVDGLPLTALPDDLEVGGAVRLGNCRGLTCLPERWQVRGRLSLRACGVQEFPPGLEVGGDLLLVDCPVAELDPDILIDGDLIIRRCAHLVGLGGREVYAGAVEIDSCPELVSLPPRMRIRGGLCLEACGKLERLPRELVVDPPEPNAHGRRRRWRRPLVEMINCPKITALPQRLKVDGVIDIGGTQIVAAEPSQFEGHEFAWRGFPISGRALFQPETLDPAGILREPNAEIRRLLVERYGAGSLFDQVDHRIIDKDEDPGGARRLVRVAKANRLGQDIQLLDCHCPSTGRRYLLEVPLTVASCHAAAAWLAGFENPDDYRPVLET